MPIVFQVNVTQDTWRRTQRFCALTRYDILPTPCPTNVTWGVTPTFRRL